MKGKILILTAVLILVLSAGCQNNSAQEAPNLSMPETAWVFLEQQEQGNTGYEFTNKADIEVLWQSLAIDQWQGTDMGNIDDDAEAIILDYDTPFNTRIILNNKDQITLVTEDNSIIGYKAPSGCYKDFTAALNDLIEVSQDIIEVTLDEESVTEIIQEIIAAETLNASDGEITNIDCGNPEVKEELNNILATPQWTKVEISDMPEAGGDIAFFFTDNSNSLVVETDSATTFLTLSYHGKLFNYYQTEGDLLTPLSQLLETIK